MVPKNDPVKLQNTLIKSLSITAWTIFFGVIGATVFQSNYGYCFAIPGFFMGYLFENFLTKIGRDSSLGRVLSVGSSMVICGILVLIALLRAHN